MKTPLGRWRVTVPCTRTLCSEVFRAVKAIRLLIGRTGAEKGSAKGNSSTLIWREVGTASHTPTNWLFGLYNDSTDTGDSHLGVNQVVFVQARGIHEVDKQAPALTDHVQLQAVAVKFDILHDAFELDPLAVLTGRHQVAQMHLARPGQRCLAQQPVSCLCNLRSEIQFLGYPFNFQQISGPEVKVFGCSR